VTLLEGLTSTVAVPVVSVTWTALPDTDAIRPLTSALPLADAGDDVAGDFALFDELHAPTDSAVAPATARIANPVSRAGSKVSCIEILSIVGRFGQIS
jgi:hypothetical protein